MDDCSVAVIGATGAVGPVFLSILEERGFPAGSIRLCASERSWGKKMTVGGQESVVERAFVRWIEDAATRLAERVTAGINGHKHEMNQSPLEKDDMIEEVINASARYEAWSRT